MLGLDFSTVIPSAGDVAEMAGALLAVGSVLLIPRLVYMGVEWISSQVGGGDPYSKSDRWLARNGYEWDDEGDLVDRDGKYV